MVRPDPRTEPKEFAEYIVDSYKRHTAAYCAGTMSEAVYRASLLALGWRKDAVAIEARLNAPEPPPLRAEKYKVVGGKVVEI